jgi:hydrogenase expression/formation protein HypC
MCLGVPGRVLEARQDDRGTVMGRVSFDGVVKDVCLAYTPDVGPGDYVIVHVGFAIARLHQAEAERLLEAFAEIERAWDVAEDVDQVRVALSRPPGVDPTRPGEDPGA